MPDDGRPGEFERYAVDCALHAARWTHRVKPDDPDHGFLDYFEAAATRNLGLLWGFETIGEDMVERGIVPPADGEQATLVTDGGRPQTVHWPTVHLVAPLPDNARGKQCQTWTESAGQEMPSQCEEEAVYVYTFGDDGDRNNLLGCEEHAPVWNEGLETDDAR